MVRMNQNMLMWFEYVERKMMNDERMTKKIYEERVSCKRSRGRSRLTFESIYIKEDGHIKSTRIPQGHV